MHEAWLTRQVLVPCCRWSRGCLSSNRFPASVHERGIAEGKLRSTQSYYVAKSALEEGVVSAAATVTSTGQAFTGREHVNVLNFASTLQSDDAGRFSDGCRLSNRRFVNFALVSVQALVARPTARFGSARMDGSAACTSQSSIS